MMENGAVGDDASLTYFGQCIFVDMDYGVILNTCVCADLDGTEITSQDSPRTDEAARADGHVADDYSLGMDKCRIVDSGFFILKSIDRHENLRTSINVWNRRPRRLAPPNTPGIRKAFSGLKLSDYLVGHGKNILGNFQFEAIGDVHINYNLYVLK